MINVINFVTNTFRRTGRSRQPKNPDSPQGVQKPGSADTIQQEACQKWIAERSHDDRIIDIIIPVYKGVDQTRRCIESVLSSFLKRRHELVVIDDCTPEPELADYLQQLHGESRITLLKNSKNIGFVQSVNRGMKHHPQRDVLLLNSDTVVANDWMDRLVLAAYRDWKIGTVTPFSNNATICSYPRFCMDNRLPEDETGQSLDLLFRQLNSGRTVDVPTAIGFCVFIKRVCLNDTGYFDEARFGRGYGEENDFCMRSAARGWRHVLAADTFVYHEGAVSFGDQLSRKMQDVMDVLETIHPGYARQIHDHIRLDPALPFRKTVDLARLAKTGKPVVLLISHNRGGGTETHIRDLTRHLDRDVTFLTIRPEINKYVSVTWDNPDESLKLFFRIPAEFDTLMAFLTDMNVARIHLHHIIDVPDLILTLPHRLGIPYDITLHDYYLACPHICLTNHNECYCGETGYRACQNCSTDMGIDIDRYRKDHHDILTQADRVLTPSRDTAARFRNYFPNIDILTAYHPDHERQTAPRMPVYPRVNSEDNLRVLILGGLTRHKGLDLLEAVALGAKKSSQRLEFHLLGHTCRAIAVQPESALTIHGRYDERTRGRLLESIRPHIGWIPALWPETYSYVLSEMMEAGLPVAATRIGALPERLKNRPLSWILDMATTPEEWLDYFAELRNDFVNGRQFESPVVHPEPDLPFAYRQHYLSFLASRAAGTIHRKPEALLRYASQPDDPFDDVAYLEANPDVAGAIASGIFISAARHWLTHGRKEGRRLKAEGAANSIQAEQPLDGPAASQYYFHGK